MRNHWTILRKGMRESKTYFIKGNSGCLKNGNGWGLGIKSRNTKVDNSVGKDVC